MKIITLKLAKKISKIKELLKTLYLKMKANSLSKKARLKLKQEYLIFKSKNKNPAWMKFIAKLTLKYLLYLKYKKHLKKKQKLIRMQKIKNSKLILLHRRDRQKM